VIDYSLPELRFQLRVFLNYSEYIERLKVQGVQTIDPDIPIELELSRTMSWIEDLSILVRRLSIEEGETQPQVN